MKFVEIDSIKLYKSDKILEGILSEYQCYLNDTFKNKITPVKNKSDELTSLIKDYQIETNKNLNLTKQSNILNKEICGITLESSITKSEVEIKNLINHLESKEIEANLLAEKLESNLAALKEIKDKILKIEKISPKEISDIFDIKLEKYSLRIIKIKVNLVRIVVIFISIIISFFISEILEPGLSEYISNSKIMHFLFSITIFIIFDLVFEYILDNFYDNFLILRFIELQRRFKIMIKVFGSSNDKETA